MWWSVASWSFVVLATACGRLDFDGSYRRDGGGAADGDAPLAVDAATVDAAPPCVLGPFTAPTTSAALNSTATDWGPTMTQDGLELVFSSDRATTGTFLIYDSTRATVTSPWSTPVAVTVAPGAQTIGGYDPYLSDDHLMLYWDGDGFQQTTRPAIGSGWTAPIQVAVNGATYGGIGGPQASPDGRQLYFTATADADGVEHMWQAARASLTVAFGEGVLIDGLAMPAGEAFGSLRGDGLEAVFQHAGGPSLYDTTRATTADPFGAQTELAALDGGNNIDAALSTDGHAMVFASDRSGTIDLWFSTRACQ